MYVLELDIDAILIGKLIRSCSGVIFSPFNWNYRIEIEKWEDAPWSETPNPS